MYVIKYLGLKTIWADGHSGAAPRAARRRSRTGVDRLLRPRQRDGGRIILLRTLYQTLQVEDFVSVWVQDTATRPSEEQ